MTGQPQSDSKCRGGVTLIVWAGLAAAIGLDVGVQLLWKQCVSGVPESADLVATLTHAITRPLTAVLLLLMVTQFANWSWLLARANLSFIKPLTALSYPLTAALACLVFNERVGPMRALGLALVIAGVWLISGTSSEQAAQKEAA